MHHLGPNAAAKGALLQPPSLYRGRKGLQRGVMIVAHYSIRGDFAMNQSFPVDRTYRAILITAQTSSIVGERCYSVPGRNHAISAERTTLSDVAPLF
jgi:hypothetical protein